MESEDNDGWCLARGGDEMEGAALGQEVSEGDLQPKMASNEMLVVEQALITSPEEDGTHEVGDGDFAIESGGCPAPQSTVAEVGPSPPPQFLQPSQGDVLSRSNTPAASIEDEIRSSGHVEAKGDVEVRSARNPHEVKLAAPVPNRTLMKQDVPRRATASGPRDHSR